jgi:hypothetical protein
LFGLDEPRTDPGGDITAADQHVLDVRDQLAALPLAKRATSAQTAFRHFAALDAAQLEPAAGEGEGSGFLPAIDPTWVTIAELRNVTLSPKDDGWVLDDAIIDIGKRPTHVATGPLQDLLAATLRPVSQGVGPRLLRSSLTRQDGKIAIRSTAPLAPQSLADAIHVSVFDQAGGWQSVTLDPPQLVDGGTQLVITAPSMPPSGRLRLWIAGTGPTPALGIDGHPLAGADDDLAPPPHTGRDFAHMEEL